MKNTTMLKILFLSLVLSSCGLIERFKTPEQPTDSKESTAGAEEESAPTTASTESSDDLFTKTMDESNSSGKDAPSNISSTPAEASNSGELKSLEDEFSSSTPTTAQEAPKAEAPVLVEEALPEIKTEIAAPTYSDEGKVRVYKVKKGETLMQIAFSLYGDISKWKDIKALNNAKLSKNASLRANMELKYRAPATPFVWNPSGTPYVIKNGETLGTISNAVYATPKKWKAIWQNNKPLIKNPNVIYAGFTLYYTNGGMANYVQPKAIQPKKEIVGRALAEAAIANEKNVEEVVVQESLAPANKAISAQDESQVDEAIQSLSSTERKGVAPAEGEIDLINNVTAPTEPEIAPDIDEEVQSLR